MASYMGVSKNRGTSKWMVKMMENPIKMDDLGKPIIFGNTHIDCLDQFPARTSLLQLESFRVEPRDEITKSSSKRLAFP